MLRKALQVCIHTFAPLCMKSWCALSFKKVFQYSVAYSQYSKLTVRVKCTVCIVHYVQCAAYIALGVFLMCFMKEAQYSSVLVEVWGHTTTWTGAHMSHDLDTDDDNDDVHYDDDDYDDYIDFDDFDDFDD